MAQRAMKYILMRNKKGDIELRFGYPFYHKDLFNRDESVYDCLGGGQWCIDTSDMTVQLFGYSDEFGKPNKNDLEQAIKNFSEWEHLEWICRNIRHREIHLNKAIKYQTD